MPEGPTSSDPHRQTQSHRPRTCHTHRYACSIHFQLQLHTKIGVYKQPKPHLYPGSHRLTQKMTDVVVHTGQLTVPTKQCMVPRRAGAKQTGQSQESGKGQQGQMGTGAVSTFLGSTEHSHSHSQDTKATLSVQAHSQTPREQSYLLLPIYSETQPMPSTLMPTHLPPGTGVPLPPHYVAGEEDNERLSGRI